MDVRKYLVLAICLFATATATAQPDIISDENVVVEEGYRPILADALKVNFNPSLPDLNAETPELTYRVPVQYLHIPYAAPDVRPLAMPQEEPMALKNVYAKLGVGNKALPYADIWLNSGRKEQRRNRDNNLNLGGHFRYISASSSKVENQRYSDMDIEGFGTYYVQNVALTAGAGYLRDVVHFYGYNDEDTSFGADEVKQRYSLFKANFGIRNSEETDADIDYDGNIYLNYLTSLTRHKELNPVVDFMLRKRFDNGNFLQTKLAYDFNSYSWDTLSRQTHLLSVQPTYRLNKDIWFAELGFNTGVDDRGFYIFPMLKFERELLDEHLVFTADLTGRVVKNNYKSLTDINPFIEDTLSIRYSRTMALGAGLRGTVADNLSYSIGATYSDVNYLPLYITDTFDTRRFEVVYDTSAVVINLHGELGYSFADRLRMILSADYFAYSLSDHDRPWHLPTAKVNLFTKYLLTEKISLTGDVFFINRMWALTPESGEQRLPGVVDINIGGTYKVSDSFHIFAQVNNITSAKHQRWYNYPSYGLNALAGLVLVF